MSLGVSENEAEKNLGNSSRFTVHEFMVDLLGGLVPGILYTAGIFLLVTSVGVAVVACSQTPVGSTDVLERVVSFLQMTKGTPNVIWIGVLIFVLLFSYVVGYSYYRRDTKEPDKASVRSELKNNTHKDDDEWKKRNLACLGEDDCQFPYPYFYEYLNERGHGHLLKYVKWGGENDPERHPNWRSKTEINRLKIILECNYPSKYRRIIRNEAHVRLATSTWYVVRGICSLSLWYCTPVVASALFIAIYRNAFESIPQLFEWIIPVAIVPIIVFLIARAIKQRCEGFIHYQRLREAFYVFQIYHTVCGKDPDKLLSSDDPESNESNTGNCTVGPDEDDFID